MLYYVYMILKGSDQTYSCQVVKTDNSLAIWRFVQLRYLYVNLQPQAASLFCSSL